jgi:hypothetical protein
LSSPAPSWRGSQLRKIAPHVWHAVALTVGPTAQTDISGSGAGMKVIGPPVERLPEENDLPVQ